MTNSLKIALLGALLFSGTAHAKAPVWKISKGDHVLFLGSTIHVLSKKDYPLPEAFERAYKASDDIVFETDAQALMSPNANAKILAVMSYQDHRGLSTVLTRETYDAFGQLLQSRGIPIAAFDALTPAGATLSLLGIELQRLGLSDGQGVDMHFDKRAQEDQKERLFLESADEQISFIGAMNRVDPNLMIQSLIKDVSQLEEQWDDMLAAWRNGNLKQLEELGIAEMQRDYPSLYQVLLLQRNRDWLSDIEAMIQTKDVEFMLVGALHMAGTDGLIHQLSQTGYKVEQLD